MPHAWEFAAFAITAGYHVPRNNALGDVDPSSASATDHWLTYRPRGRG